MSESPADEPPGYGKHLDLAGRVVPADDSPVPAGPATVPMGARPGQGPGRLVLRAPYWFALFLIVPGLIVLIGSAVLLLGQVLGMGRHVHLIAFAFALIPLVLLQALMAWFWFRQAILPRLTFDQEAGLLRLGWKGLRGRRPLSSVLGVQVMQTRKQFGGPELNIAAVTMYQLNLILDDPAERRLNVMTCDPLTARANARLVADFLGVPVLDSAGAPASAAADTVNPMPLELWWIQSPVVTEPGPDVLLIRSRRLAILSLYGRMSPVGLIVLLVLAVQGGGTMWILAAIVGASSCLPLLGLLTQGRQAQFDRARGVLTLRRLGRQTPRPLASVKAVEVVDGPIRQLNLLPDDPRQPRLNLIWSADAADAALVRRTAERVASFLSVPLLGAGRQAPAAAQSGGAKTFNPLEELDRSPLPSGKASIRGPARILSKGDDILVLRPRSGFRWVWLTPALLTVALDLYIVWLALRGQAGLGQSAAWLVIALFGAVSTFSALKPLLLYRDHFDRQAGLLKLGGFGLKRTYPLDKVLAVQLVPGGLIAKAPGPFGHGRERVSYQLNLVTADAEQDRLNLTDDSDLKWTRQAGRQVADFLGVPVIDQIADGD